MEILSRPVRVRVKRRAKGTLEDVFDLKRYLAGVLDVVEVGGRLRPN